MVVNKYAKYRQPEAPVAEEPQQSQGTARTNKYARFRTADAAPAQGAAASGFGLAIAGAPQPEAPQENSPFVPERDNAAAMGAMIRKDYQGAIPEQPRYFKRPAPVMLPDELAALDAEKAREALRAQERREAAGAFGGGMDLMPTEDAGGNVRPGTDVDADLAKGIGTAPIQFGQGLGEGVANVANVGFAASTGLYNAGANLADPGREQAQPYRLEFPRNEFLENEGASVSGMAPRIAGQVMSTRVPIGKAMPGGGFGAEVAKDAMAFGLSTPQDAPRLSDMVPGNTPVIGGVADFLKSNPDDNAFTAFGKNAAEDALVGGGLGTILRGGVKAVDAIGNRAPLPPATMARAPVIAPPQPIRPVGPSAAADAAGPSPFSASPEPTRLNSITNNAVTRNADRIAGGAVGASLGGVGDAYAAPGDGGDGGPPIGAGIGATIGIFGPRAMATMGSRGYRAAARTMRPPAVRGAFDERVAAKAVRDALKSGGITSPTEAAAAFTSRFGDKPAAVADLTQEAVGTAAGLSRLPGATGEVARARGEDLLQNRAGRLERDIAGATGASPATISGDVERMVQLAREQATPAYTALREQYPFGTFASPRLDALRELEILSPHIRGVERYRDTLAATEGRVVGDFEFWDLVKRSLDDAEQSAAARNQPVPYDLDSARQAIVREVDQIVPDYAAARQLGGEAPRMQQAFRDGQGLLGGRYTTEDVSRVVEGVTGQQLTAMQAGVIRSMVGKAEGSRNTIAALTSTGAHRKLAEVFGPEAADQMRARFLADGAIVNNAHRINPNVGSVTSQAQLSGGLGPLLAEGIRAVRNPAEAALAALSRSGSYSKAQRDRMGEMFLGGATDENLARIFPPSRGNRRGPPSAPPGPPATPPRPPVKNGFGSSSLDMSEPARMQRAREQGFDVDTPYYHGTHNARDIDSFDMGRAGNQSGSGEEAIFLSDSPKRANKYAEPAMRDLQEPTPEAWEKSKKTFGLNDEQMRDLHRRTAPTPGVFKTYVRGPVREVDWVEYTGSHRFNSDAMERLIAEQRANGGGNIRIRNMADGGNDPNATTMVVLDPKNIRATTAAFDPSQSGSSKLLAGMGGSAPEFIGAGGGGALGYFGAQDTNGDGTVDDNERRAQGLGGLVSGLIVVKGARAGVEGVRGLTQHGRDLKQVKEMNAGVRARIAAYREKGVEAAKLREQGVNDLMIARRLGLDQSMDGKPSLDEVRYEVQAAIDNAAQPIPEYLRAKPDQTTFGGVNAKTADLKLKGIAEQMEKAGAGRDQIWKETGWFKGNDGKWRFEIDDSRAGFNAATKREFEDKGVARVGKGPNGVALKTAFNHSEAGNAYPSYAWTALKGEIRPGAPARGAQAGSPYGNGGPGSISFRSPDLEEGRSVVLHEGQHGVQDVEGFARGGTPDQQKAVIKAQRQGDVQPIHDEMRAVLSSTDRNTYETWNEFALARVNGDIDRISQIENMLAATKDGKKLLDLEWKARSIGSGSVSETDSFEAYRRLAGETEARNVQTRRDFTPEERRARPPWTTQDVPDEQQIVRYGSGQQNSEGPWGPRGTGDRPWTVEDNRTALRKLDELKRELADAPASQWADIEAEMGAIRKQLGIESAYNAPTSTAPNPRMGALPADDPFGDRAWAAQKKGLPPPQAEAPAIDTRAWSPQDFAAARTQLREDIAYRKTAPASEHANLDEQIAALRNALGATDGPPSSEGVIMDAKDPGRRVAKEAPARAPAQAGFSFGGKGPSKPPGAKLGAGRKQVRQGPRKVTLSDAEMTARTEVTKARRAEAAQRRKYVMRDNRDDYLAPFEKATQEAEAKLAAVQAKERNARVARVERRTMARTALKHPIAIGLGGGAIGSAAVIGMTKFVPQKDYDAPPDPRRPEAFWEDVATKDKATVGEIQGALHEWGNWPTEKRTLPSGREVEERIPQTGTYGKVTKAAVKRWRYERGLDPAGPMTRSDLERLLVGPRGYQDDEGHWRYARGGEQPKLP